MGVTSVSPDVLVGAIQSLEKVEFYGKMNSPQMNGILTLVKDNRQGRLKDVVIEPSVGVAGSVSRTLIEEARMNTTVRIRVSL